MVYVDSAPGVPPLDPDFEDAEKPLSWEELSAEENLDGLSEEQMDTFRRRPCPSRAASSASPSSSRTTLASTSPRR
jgi:hypothetical protein